MTMLQLPWPPIPGIVHPKTWQVLRLKNTTDLPDNTVLEIVRVCLSELGLDMSDFDITLSNYRYRFMGRCYTEGCWLHRVDPLKPLVVVRITPKKEEFPCWVDYPSKTKSRSDQQEKESALGDIARSYQRRGYISHWLLSREECLVHVLSHEIRHVWQINHKRGWMRGARGKRFSERDADAFALRVVRAWRRRRARHEAEVALERAAFLFALLIVLVAALAQKRRVGFSA